MTPPVSVSARTANASPFDAVRLGAPTAELFGPDVRLTYRPASTAPAG